MPSVLVVDDEEDIRELVRINLELDGHEVRAVSTGVDALAALDEQVPDVIVLDVMMPGMDGWEVLSQIKSKRGPVADVPVLMLTARTDDMDRIRGGIEGAIRYITKPFSLAKLRDEVRQALEGEPEPVKRRQAQRDALEELARLEKGEGGDGSQPEVVKRARPRLTKLEGAPEPRVARGAPARVTPDQLERLSPKQAELLRAVATTATVRSAAERLGVSRSNVYASLRRIARKLGVKTVPELVTLARQGGFPDQPGS